jgi:hypothetical protein
VFAGIIVARQRKKSGIMAQVPGLGHEERWQTEQDSLRTEFKEHPDARVSLGKVRDVLSDTGSLARNTPKNTGGTVRPGRELFAGLRQTG